MDLSKTLIPQAAWTKPVYADIALLVEADDHVRMILGRGKLGENIEYHTSVIMTPSVARVIQFLFVNKLISKENFDFPIDHRLPLSTGLVDLKKLRKKRRSQ